MRVGVDMVAHITLQHGNIFKMQRKRKSRRGGSHSTLSLLRKELREGNLQSLFGGSSRIASSTNTAPDPLLSSFILPMADDFGSLQLHSSAETASVKKRTNEYVSESCNLACTYGSSNLLLYRSRIRRRSQGDPSLFKVCYCPPCLMTAHEVL
ncbi:hypothetical protein RHGRI_014425 [Rhododendron griersonianum]|nr:hypothetical protein RHGRI_014425 [Rhododendron griersonianum]